MKLIIAGSRTLDIGWFGVSSALYLSRISEVSEVVCGMARGIDLAGREFAAEDWRQDYPQCSSSPIPVAEFPADWDKYGKGAGHIRNKQMAEYADALLLIWDGESRGSSNMKENMLKLNKPVYEVILKRRNV
jgi:hypothetical protein